MDYKYPILKEMWDSFFYFLKKSHGKLLSYIPSNSVIYTKIHLGRV